MLLKNLVAGLLLCLCFNALSATKLTYEGVVKDDSGNPVEFANVALLSLNNDSVKFEVVQPWLSR